MRKEIRILRNTGILSAALKTVGRFNEPYTFPPERQQGSLSKLNAIAVHGIFLA